MATENVIMAMVKTGADRQVGVASSKNAILLYLFFTLYLTVIVF